LIVSSHPLFGKGIKRLLESRFGEGVNVVGMVASVEEAIAALMTLHPDLVVVDYDDGAVNREEFLARFVESEHRLRVVLLSLKEGGSNAIVYDRRTMAASQVEDWLKEWADQGSALSSIISMGKPIVQRSKFLQMKNNLIHGFGALVFVFIMTAIGLLVLRTDILLPEQASLQAVPIDNLFGLHFRLIAFLFALIVGTILYSVIFFRRKKGDITDAVHITGNTNLEIAWTVVPLITVLAFSFIGSDALAKTLKPDPKPLEVKVTGQQWAWRFEYPDQGIISNELVLPVNKQVVLRLQAVDVIHSFWVPEFRVKQDLVPGQVKILRITPSKVGSYQLMCAEICGQQHAYMVAPVKVETQDEFDNWINVQLNTIPTDPVARGQFWLDRYGCKACHSLDGTKLVGPSFLGLYGRQETFEDGSTAIADEAYIYESIREPGKKIVLGYPNAMPANVAQEMTDEQIQDIIEFIKTLK